MKITRQQFLIVAALFIFALSVHAQSTQLALVGTYTTKTQSKGIYTLDFSSATGKISSVRLAAEAVDPSWVVIHPNGKWAYAANEAGKASTVTSFALDAKTGKLTQLNQLPAQGEDPCYLSLDKTAKFLFAANYTSGTVTVFPILADGKLGEYTAAVKDPGPLGPNKERQEAPHAHWIESSADNRFVFVSDLGLDKILIYRFDAAKGTLTPNEPAFAELAPGAGPRHMTFHPNGKFAFVLSEINSTVTALAFDAKGAFHQLQVVSTLPKGFQGRNETAEIAVHPSGKWLFASNRGEDSIAVFSIDPQTGGLQQTGDYPTGGKEPRHFALDPSGKFLLAENENSDSIVEFRFDPATGSLTTTGESVSVPAPVCLIFAPTH